MADTKKKAPKTTKAKAVKKSDKLDLTVASAELEKQLASKLQDYSDARRSHKSGELVNPRVLTTTRRDIARLKTALRAKELTKEEK